MIFVRRFLARSDILPHYDLSAGRTFDFDLCFDRLLVHRFLAFFCSFARLRDCFMLLSRFKIAWQ